MSVPKCSECDSYYGASVPYCTKFMGFNAIHTGYIPKPLKTSPRWCPKRKCNKGKDVLSKSMIKRIAVQRGEDLSKVDVDNIYRQAKEN